MQLLELTEKSTAKVREVGEVEHEVFVKQDEVGPGLEMRFV
jgi:hypothetical protein